MSMQKYMKEALILAKKGRDFVYPNPMVGCIIVKDDKVIGKGWHKVFGGDHAEINALKDAGKKAKGADLYVTLEPCNSYGKRPPCTKAIIDAGIKKVVFAVKDPNVSGSKKVFKSHGIEVASGILEKEAKLLIDKYLKHLKEKSRVTVKAAMTLDGKIATKDYDSKWITSQRSRELVHKIRAEYDAILVGYNTALKDNPFLSSHSKGKNPIRVIIDPKLKLPKKYNIFDTSIAATVIIYDESIKKIPSHLKKEGIIPAPINISKAKKDFGIIIKKLNDMSLKSILIEGGGNIISSALFSKCVDDICFFIAPKIIGGKNAVTVVEGEGVSKISQGLNLENIKCSVIGQDLMIKAKLKK